MSPARSQSDSAARLDVLRPQLVEDVRDEHEVGVLSRRGEIPLDPGRLAEGRRRCRRCQRAPRPRHRRLDLDERRPLELRPDRGCGPRRDAGPRADVEDRPRTPVRPLLCEPREHEDRRGVGRRCPSGDVRGDVGVGPRRARRRCALRPVRLREPRRRGLDLAAPDARDELVRSPRAARPAGRGGRRYAAASASAGCRTRSRAAAKWIASYAISAGEEPGDDRERRERG